MNRAVPAPVRCAIYTRNSTEEGLEQAFNSLDAQREACAAYVMSQQHEGWALLPDLYDDGGISGGTMDRPAMQRLLADVREGKVDVIVVYKVDQLTRRLIDFANIVEVLDKAGASFVSVTQAFNTTNSMGRLTLNVLLSFTQLEREVTGERIRRAWAVWKKLTSEQRPDNAVERSHLVRLARLRFLAPDITLAIIEGRQPVELTARALLRCGELPVGWADQPRALGFA